MGWNRGWAIIEEQVIGLYNLDVLTLPVLDVLCRAVGDSDIDQGGSAYLTSKDGKSMEEIMLALVFGEDAPCEPEEIDSEEWEKYWDIFSDMTAERWGWR